MNRPCRLLHRATWKGILLLAAAGCVPRTGDGRRPPPPDRLVFPTGALRVSVAPETLAWRVEDPAGAPLLKSRLVVEAADGGIGRTTARRDGNRDGNRDGIPRNTALGPARVWSSVLAEDGGRLEIELVVTVFERRRALRLAVTLHNASTQTVTVNRIALAGAPDTRLAVPAEPDRLRLLLLPPTTRGEATIRPATAPADAASRSMTLAVDPASGWTVLAGFPAPRTGRGTLTWEAPATGGSPGLRLEAVAHDASTRLGPDERLAAEDLLLVWDSDPHAAMEAYARAAGENGAALAPVPAGSPSVVAGWGTGLACRGDLSEGALLQNLDVVERYLKPAGLDLILIEDGYQRAAGDWETHARLPRGHRWITRQIHDRGFRAGLALAPCNVSELSPLFASRPPWLTRGPDGSRRVRIDAADADARRWLAELAQRIAGNWNYDAVLATRLVPDTPPGTGEEDAGDSDDPACRNVLETFREILGTNRLLLAAESTPAAACGLADAVRVGPDAGAGWTRVRETARALASFQAFGRRAWRVGAGGVSLAPPLTNDEALSWAGLLAVTGGLLISGDDLALLPPDRIALHQKLLPPVPAGARAIDLFDAPSRQDPRRPPAVWHRPVRWEGGRADLVLLVNWSDEPERVAVPLARLGLGKDPSRVACDLVEGVIRDVSGGMLVADLRPHASSRVLLRPAAGRPQVAGTSRHLVPGAFDLSRVAWNGKTRVLSGRSRGLIPPAGRVPGTVEAGYAILVHVPADYRFTKVGASVPCLATRTGPRLIRVEFPETNGEVIDWKLHFTQGEESRKPEAPR